MWDIIDNRRQDLVTELASRLRSTSCIRFVLTHLFVPGLESIVKELDHVSDARFLIGSVPARDTREQLVQRLPRLELIGHRLETNAYPKRSEAQEMVRRTAAHVRLTLEHMDQTDAAQAALASLAELLESGRLNVRLCTRAALSHNTYIFSPPDRDTLTGDEPGDSEVPVAIIGSTNVGLAAVRTHTDLNVLVRGAERHDELAGWFDNIWDDARDFSRALLAELRACWALAAVRPYDIYMKTILTLVKDRLEGGEEEEVLWDDDITEDLADFQKVAVRQALQIIRDTGGAFVADVVGLGKSFIGAAIIKHFERVAQARPLVICPATLVDMWERYNEAYGLNARVVSMGLLREDEEANPHFLLDKYPERDFLLIDESHNLRHPDTQRYKVVEAFLATGRRCCLLTATPRNKSAWDIYHQIKLFHQDEVTDLPIDPPHLRQHFALIERGERTLPDLLQHILLRRTRNHILRWYGYDADTDQPIDPTEFSAYLDGSRRAYVKVGGRHQMFPKRKLTTINYSIEASYNGLYQQIRDYLGAGAKPRPKQAMPGYLTYARYGLGNYVGSEKRDEEPYSTLRRAGLNLHGLMRIMLFKRLESSVHAFRRTVERLLRAHERFLTSVHHGVILAGEEASAFLMDDDFETEVDFLSALRGIQSRYSSVDFDTERLAQHIANDIGVLREILTLIEPISPPEDAKLQTLKRCLETSDLAGRKCLIFSQYADTAQYLYDNLNPDGERDDIDVIYSSEKRKTRVVGRFSPRSNPELARTPEIITLIATDVLAEGLNLQDCDRIINYDLHWNPVRLIQRFGRIDRIGSEHSTIHGFNFLPETGIEQSLGLRARLENRIREIHETIGEDTAILDPSEQLNEEALYAIYEGDSAKVAAVEDAADHALPLGEAEELLRQLRHEDPAEYDRIANLPNGIRAGVRDSEAGTFVCCEAARYHRVFVCNEDSHVVSTEVPFALGRIRNGPEIPAEPLPEGHNSTVMATKAQFEKEVHERWTQQRQSASLTRGQQYVLKGIKALIADCQAEDRAAQIRELDRVFRRPTTSAVNRELNRLRRNGVRGANLLKMLVDIYHQHGMRDWLQTRQDPEESRPLTSIVTSMAFV